MTTATTTDLPTDACLRCGACGFVVADMHDENQVVLGAFCACCGLYVGPVGDHEDMSGGRQTERRHDE